MRQVRAWLFLFLLEKQFFACNRSSQREIAFGKILWSRHESGVIGGFISLALWSTQKLGTGTMLKWIHQKKVFLFYACFVVKTSNVAIFTLTLNRVELKCVLHVQHARFWHATVNSFVTTSIVFLRNRYLCTCLNVVCIPIHANAPYLVTKINKLWNHLSSEYRREDPRVNWNKRSCY